MLKTYLISLFCIAAAVFGMSAQCTSVPSPLQEDSQDVVIYFHADEGNQGLMGQPASAEIYAHTGLITSKSGSDSDWKFAPTWGDNSPKYKMEYVSPNLWKLYIGDIRTYYGVTDPNEEIKKLAFVFRTADKKKEGKGPGNSDIFVNVVDAGLQVAIESNIPGSVVTITSVDAHFKVGSTVTADLTLSINGTQIAEAKSAVTLEADYTFPGPGDYKVVATATAGGQTVTAEEFYCFAKDSQQSALTKAPSMGAYRMDNDQVQFCIAAPQKNSVILVGSWNDYRVTNDQVMDYIDDPATGVRYFTISVNGLERNKTYLYYYYVDAAYQVSDPYARLVLDPSYDKYIPESVYPNLPAYPYGKLQTTPLAIFQDNLGDYKWNDNNFKAPSKTDLVIYELLFRDFTGTEGKADGNGTVNLAIQKLDYLKKLGVNAIELLPITEFNGNLSWGYNPNFYFAPDKAYGTIQDYKKFIDLCHQNGIAVILDMVFNQTDWLHPWYRMYESGKNPFYNATAPHAYSVLNDWNQGYVLVEQQWKDCLKYWMEEYHVDGFRFDLVKGLGNNDSYASPSDASTNAYNKSRVERMKRLHAAMKEVNPDAYFINENLAGSQEENEMAADGELNWANVNTAGCQYAMGFSSDANLNRMYAPLDGRTWGSTVAYLESHDEQRLAYKQQQFGASGVKGNTKVSMQRLGSAAAQMIMAPGSHMIWMFSEMGNAQNTKDNSNGNNTDCKIVNWNLLNETNHKALVDSYTELIHIRLGNPELFTQDAQYSMACNVNNWAGGRTLVSSAGDKELITVVNPNIAGVITVSVPFQVKDNSKYQILSQSYDCNATFQAATGSVTIPANCYVVIGRNASTDVKSIDKTGFEVITGNGRITVNGADAPVYVYSISGLRIAEISGAAPANVDVVPGLYVVKSGDRSVKVAVK